MTFILQTFGEQNKQIFDILWRFNIQLGSTFINLMTIVSIYFVNWPKKSKLLKAWDESAEFNLFFFERRLKQPWCKNLWWCQQWQSRVPSSSKNPEKSYCKRLTSIWIWFQAIGNALCATGFGESIAGLLSENEVPNPLIERSIAAFVIVMLTLINFAGVKWVIRLQFWMLGILVLGAKDFGIGSFTHTNEGKKML